MGNIWTENYGDQYFMDYDLSKLKRDNCYLSIDNQDYDQVHLYSKYDECYKCPYTYELTVTKSSLQTLILDTSFSKKYRILENKVDSVLEQNYDGLVGPATFGDNYSEFGIYKISIANSTCNLQMLKEPVNIYFPILTVFLIYFALFLSIRIGRFIWKHLKFERLDLPFISKKTESNSKRVQSLDTFRGISIVVMIFANYGHGGYPFLEHAVWNGLCVGDLVFPWFLWIMGVCIPISVSSYFKKEDASYLAAIKNILKRSIKLFLIGLFLGASPYLDKLRIFGVLQRFAICYFTIASANILLNCKNCNVQNKFCLELSDLVKLKFQWLFAFLIVLLHCLLTFCLKVPGCPSGYLGPGGLHDNKQFQNCTGGAAGYIDKVILGQHIYHYPEIVKIYKSQPFDPEGILGCLTSIFQVFLGVQAGTILLTFKSHKERLLRWFLWSIITGLIGGILCNFSKEDGIIPINKHLWSLSFVLVTSCFAFFLLAICYIIIDVYKWWSGKPFLFAGMNAILMYIGHNMTYGNYFPIHWYLSADQVNPSHFISLLENIWATCFWIFVAYVLYKRKFFWTV